MICPATVQTATTVTHPWAGAALVSPDASSGQSFRAGPARPLPLAPPVQSSDELKQPQTDASSSHARAAQIPLSPEMMLLAPRVELKPKPTDHTAPSLPQLSSGSGGARLNKFVRRLHDMLVAEKDSGIVEWRRGLLVLHSTDAFAKSILPKYFNTRNFKTFRTQLNYYGFVHVRSFSTTGSTTTALWVNRDLAKHGSADISSVLMLKRVEPCESAKTAEGRRVRKEMAIFTVEEDIGVSAKTLQMEQIRSLAMRAGVDDLLQDPSLLPRHLPDTASPPVPTEVHCRLETVPPPPFPRLNLKPKRQMVPAKKPEMVEIPQVTREPSDVTSQEGQRLEPEKPEKRTVEDHVSAANLLLMLAQGGRTSSCSGNNSSNSSISAESKREEVTLATTAPSQYLM